MEYEYRDTLGDLSRLLQERHSATAQEVARLDELASEFTRSFACETTPPGGLLGALCGRYAIRKADIVLFDVLAAAMTAVCLGATPARFLAVGLAVIHLLLKVDRRMVTLTRDQVEVLVALRTTEGRLTPVEILGRLMRRPDRNERWVLERLQELTAMPTRDKAGVALVDRLDDGTWRTQV